MNVFGTSRIGWDMKLCQEKEHQGCAIKGLLVKTCRAISQRFQKQEKMQKIIFDLLSMEQLTYCIKSRKVCWYYFENIVINLLTHRFAVRGCKAKKVPTFANFHRLSLPNIHHKQIPSFKLAFRFSKDCYDHQFHMVFITTWRRWYIWCAD